MKKRIFKVLILAICVVSAFGLGTIKKKEINNIKTKTISNNEDYNLNAGITNDIANALEYAKDVSVVVKEKRFESYSMYTNCCVNIREKSNINSPAVTTVNPNILVRVIGENGDWCKVLLNDTIGYIKAEYLSLDKTPISKLNRWGIELTDDEIDLLALIVKAEAGNQSMTGKEAVVEVIFNRMISDTLGGDLYSVLSADGQFTTWSSRHNETPSEDEYTAIYNVLYGKTNILEYEYVYFSRGRVNGHDFIKIGDHWFSKGKCE